MQNPAQQRHREIRGTLIFVLALNWAVAAAKIFFGFFTQCTSMVADGLHSVSDGASNIIGLTGIRLASQPKDKDHPYGHKKYETFYSLGIAMLLFIIAIGIAHQAWGRLRHPPIPQIDYKNFAVMLITKAINLGVMRYELKKGKALASDILTADALHTKADIFTSLSVIIALVVIKMGFPVLDPIAAIIIALFIAHSGYDIVRQSSVILCDTVVITDLKKISDIVLGVKGVKTCHKIRTRGRPDDIHVDLHVQVDADMHIDAAHRISYVIEGDLKKEFPEITDVVVHMEPKEKN
jgi:cation diffusion facilitator family transporter